MANGIVIIDKPQGWTSMDVCAKLRGILHEKRVGHAGTLDPMATGVLPVFVGRATRAVEFADKSDKEYIAGLKLGVITNTQDTSGQVEERHPVSVTPDRLEEVLGQFRGDILQVPPMYSAIKINGKKLYELARKGREVERPAPAGDHPLPYGGRAERPRRVYHPGAVLQGHLCPDPVPRYRDGPGLRRMYVLPAADNGCRLRPGGCPDLRPGRGGGRPSRPCCALWTPFLLTGRSWS